MARGIQIIGLETLPEITAGCDLAQLLVAAAEAEGTPLVDGDIVVVAQKIVSKAEGRVVNLAHVLPSEHAVAVGALTGKDPRFVEVILREAKALLKVSNPYLVTETHFGHICLNAGVDRSNVAGSPEICALLPRDPDASARALRAQLEHRAGCRLAVIISDTYSRPHRFAQVDLAIGASGIQPVKTYQGAVDPYGYTLRVKMQAIADEVAAAAELVIGQVGERVPAAILRGYTYTADERSSAKALSLIKRGSHDLFEGVVLVPEAVESIPEAPTTSRTE